MFSYYESGEEDTFISYLENGEVTYISYLKMEKIHSILESEVCAKARGGMPGKHVT